MRRSNYSASLTANEADFVASPDPVQPAAKPGAVLRDERMLRDWLGDYEGN
jgi:hypothetical protein